MEDFKRIRLVFKDDDILSETQKLDGLNRSWLLLKSQQDDSVSDVASHLLHAFQLHESCPHGLLLSISGFVLPPFESSHILKDKEIIRVRKRRDVLSIAGNNAAIDVENLKGMEKQPVNTGVLLLANDEFEKEKGGYESDDPEEDAEGLLRDVDNPSCSKAAPKSRKRKATEKLGGSKKKKRHAEATEGIADNASKEKNEKSILDGDLARKKRLLSEGKKDESSDEDNAEKNEETAELNPKSHVPVPGITRNDEILENEEDIEDGEIVPKYTKKGPSRSARRKTKKRQWLKAMAELQKKNATCESEGFRNWKEDQAKTKRKTVTGLFKGQRKWKKYQADTERNEADDQPKGLLHWKQSPQESWSVKGKKRRQQNQHDNFPKQQNRIGSELEQPTQNGDELEEQNGKLADAHEQLGENTGDVQEQSKRNSDAPKLSNQYSDEENEVVVPIVVRPGHIRFEPLGKDQAIQKIQEPPETFQWNGITSKKKGQQWGKENRSFTPRNNYKSSNKEYTEIASTENENQPELGVEFDKLPPLSSMPKVGDLIAYRVVELSSTWTPEISGFRVGKVSWCNVGSSQLMLMPVPEFPIVSQKADGEEDEAVQLDNSLYKEDGSLEIDFSSLIDARIFRNGSSGPATETLSQQNEGALGNENTAKAVSPSSSDKQTAEPRPDSGGVVDIWEQLGQALSAKKEELAKENGWNEILKKVQPPPENGWGTNSKKVQEPSTKSAGWGKNAHKVQSSQDNALGEQNSSGGKPWPYKGLRGGGLGSTMAILRSKKDI